MDLVKRHYGQSMPKLLQGALSTIAGQGQGLREVLAVGLPAAWEVRLTHPRHWGTTAVHTPNPYLQFVFIFISTFL